MKPVVVLGVGATAELAHLYLDGDSPHDVVAFTVDRDYRTTEEFRGLPVVPLDEVQQRYPPESFSMFVAVGYGRMNTFREHKYREAKDMGYDLVSYISSRASVWPEAMTGDNCFVMQHNVIEPFSKIGSNVIIWSGSQIGHYSIIGDHTFIAAQAVIAGQVTVEPNCFIGVNATIRDSVTIGRECVIGAGVLILKSTLPRQVYVGQSGKLLAMPSNRLVSL